MALCINNSGTWRDITTQCVNQSGTWRKVATGCINDSGTWRKFGFGPALGSAYEGGYFICASVGVRWVVAPSSAEVSRTWYCRNDASTRAQQVSGCTGWFVPNASQLQNPGFVCRTYWDSYCPVNYWSSAEGNAASGCYIFFGPNNGGAWGNKTVARCARAFRCVTY